MFQLHFIFPSSLSTVNKGGKELILFYYQSPPPILLGLSHEFILSFFLIFYIFFIEFFLSDQPIQSEVAFLIKHR